MPKDLVLLCACVYCTYHVHLSATLLVTGLMDELAGLLPFPREVTSQMDTKTVLRLAVCYLR